MSLYLKYRPQKTFELDSTVVRAFYADLLASGTFSHAYLFSGPRGTGKTSAARILAKIINCEHNRKAVLAGKPLSEPCGECSTCRRITVGSSLAVMEMDAASNRGIDDIRALRDRIALAPAESPYIVYIIDEVHMLTTEAFNALLKTLEEPPAHAVFALCTTELHKLPQTVVSRCTQVLYPKPTTEEVMGSLRKAVTGEEVTISETALRALAGSVDGSFRDGMKFLEQLMQKGTTVSDEAVFELVHQTSQYEVLPFIEALIKRDGQKALALLSKMEEQAIDVGVYIKKVLMELRVRLREGMLNNNSDVIDLIQLIQLTADAGIASKSAYIPLLPLEVVVAERCLLQDQKSKIKDQNELEEQTLKQPTRDTVSVNAKPTYAVKATPTKPVVKDEAVVTHKQVIVGDVSLSLIESQWQAILAGVKPLNHSLEALLRSSRPLSADATSLVIEVFYAFHRDKLDEEKNKQAIEKVIADVLGKALRLSFVLGSAGSKPLPTKAPVKSSANPNDLVSAAEEIFG